MTAGRRDGRGRLVVTGLYAGLLGLLILAASLRERAAFADPQAPGSPATDSTLTDTAAADTAVAGFAPAPRARTLPRTARQGSWIVADRFIDRTVNGKPVSYLIGNVYIDRDTVVVRADSARVYRDREFARLFGHVRMRQFSTRMSSDRADYSRQSQDADFYDNVHVLEGGVLATARRGEMREQGRLMRLFEDAVVIAPEYTVMADTVVRDRTLDHGEAFGHVRIIDPKESTLVTGRHAVFAADGTWAEVDESPVLTSREEGGEPATSVAGRMRFYRSEERVVMTDSVRLRQGRTHAQADTAVAFGKQRMVLRGHPEVSLDEGSRMRGDEITFFYLHGQLVRVVLVGDAHMEDGDPDSLAAVYTGLPALDTVDGDSITVHLQNKQVSSTVVIGNAHSVYVPTDVDEEVAFNDVNGDTLVIDFHGGRVRKVNVRGSMSGVYHFARIAAMRGKAASDSAAVDTTAAVETTAVADSLVAAIADSAALRGDFTAHEEAVNYSGQAVAFDLAHMTIDVSQDARLVYGDMTLTAQEVQLDTRTRELYASGQPLLEQNETIVGQRMGYDFANKTGAVKHGITTFDNYYYVGDEIYRYPDGSLKIHGGKMTSCDLERPHYHFWADKMKMRIGDQVVAAPIVMKVGKVPVFALPFYFKSLKQGRRSGILFPNFNVGWSSRTGRYIRDLGYFWATNDYTDFTFEVDYNEHSEIATRLRNRYNKRYAFSGGIDYTRRVSLRAGEDLKEWQLAANHNQPHLFDDYTFRASVKMASRTLTSNDLNSNVGRDILDQNRKSTMFVSRKFNWASMSLNADRTEQLNADDNDPLSNNEVYNMTLPSLSISPNQIALAPALPAGQKGSMLGELARNTYLTQSYSMRNYVRKRERTDLHTYAASGNWSLRVRPPRIGFLNPSFGASGSQSWQRDVVTGRDYYTVTSDTDTVGYYAPIDSVHEVTRPSLAYNAGVTTTLYGVFPARVGALRAIRHTLGLSASGSFQPQLGSKQDRRSSYSFSMSNRFDVKYAAGATDSGETLKKLDGLIDWTMGTGYTPKAPSGRMWNNVSSRITIKPGSNRNLNLGMSNTIDPYRRRIISTQLNYAFGFRGRFDTGWLGKEREQKRNAAIDQLEAMVPDSSTAVADSLANPADQDAFVQDDFYGGFDEPNAGRGESGGAERDATEGGRLIPWNLNGSLTYSRQAGGASTARANLSVSAFLTHGWELSYSSSFDLSAGATTRQTYRLQRDLHCWRLEFYRVLAGVNDSQFGFRFYLKAIPELKLTQGKEDLLGSAGGLASGGLY